MASIRERRRANGTTTHSVLWRDASGIQTSMSFGDHRSAENFRRILESTGHDLNAAKAMIAAIARKAPLLQAVAEEHVTGLAGVSERTRADYRRQIAKHITPAFGGKAVDLITPQDIRDWLNHLDASDLADKTIANLHGLMSAIMTTAAEHGYRPDNPCRGIRLPRSKAHRAVEMTFLEPDEWAAVDDQLALVADGHYQLHFRMLIGTGIRWGELGGLQVGDLNLATNPPTVRISRALKRDSLGAMFVGPTKTRRSVRSVSLDGALATELADLVAGKRPGDRLFSAQKGGPLDQHHMRSRIWLPAIAAADIGKRPRIHDLRHSHASWLIAAGVDLLTVQRRLGHESITTTANRYSHLLPGQHRAAADAIGAALRRDVDPIDTLDPGTR